MLRSLKPSRNLFPLRTAVQMLSDAIPTRNTSRQVVSILGAPMVLGQSWMGTEKAPDFLRKNGLSERISNLGFQIEDRGNLEFPKRSMYMPREFYKDVVGAATKQIAQEWCNIASDPSKFVLLLGGDQSISIGSIAGSLKTNKDTVTVWVDSRANLRTKFTSNIGSFHKMSAAYSLRLPGIDFEHFEWLDDYPVLEPNNLIYIGLSKIHPSEKEILKKKQIKAFTMRDIDERGIGQVMDEVTEHIGGRTIHLSFDVVACETFHLDMGDGFKSRELMLTYRELHYIFETLASTGKLSSMDLCEINPELDNFNQDSSFDDAILMIESCLGKKI